jgi:hypothetical protein
MVRFFQLAAAMILAMSSLIAVNAFHTPTPSSQRSTSLIFSAKMMSGATFRQQKHYGKLGSMELQMSSDGDDSSEKSKAVISADGTFYDDEVSTECNMEEMVICIHPCHCCCQTAHVKQAIELRLFSRPSGFFVSWF